MYNRRTRGLLYFIYFILMGLTIIADSHTEQELSAVMAVIDNTYGDTFFGLWFVASGFLSLYTSLTAKKWQLLGFAPYLVYGTAALFLSLGTEDFVVSIFGNLVFSLLAAIMLSDWLLDSGLVGYVVKRFGKD